jgi:hypothetical protein
MQSGEIAEERRQQKKHDQHARRAFAENREEQGGG